MRPGDGPVVAGFVAGGFRVDQGVYRAMLLTPERVEEWVPPSFEALTAGDLAPLLALDPRPEFILLGTGARMLRPSRALVAALEGEGVGVEPMDSRAAARAWGVLRAEGRWVAGAFYPLV